MKKGFIIITGFLVCIAAYILYIKNSAEYGHNIEVVLDFPYENVYPGEERHFTKNITISNSAYFFSSYPQVIGNPALMHHAIIMHSDTENRFCGTDSSTMPVLSATGSELNAFNIENTQYGVFVKEGDRLLVSVHIANPGDKVESGLFQWTLRGATNRKPIEVVYFSVVDFCTIERKETNIPYEFIIPSGVIRYEKNMERLFTMPEDGKLVAWGGHLHTHGVSLSFIKNGKEMGTFFAEKNPRDIVDTVRSVYIPFKILDVPVGLKKGDVINMRAVYEKPADLFYPGAMANGYLLIDFEL